MAPPQLPPETPAPSTSTLGTLLRISGAGVVISAGISLAWPFRSILPSQAAPAPTIQTSQAVAAPPAHAAQVVFQSPEQSMVPVKVVRSPKRTTIPSKHERPAAPPPAALPPAEMAMTPPELPSQFAGIEHVGPSLRGSAAALGSARRDEAWREHRLVDGDTLQRLAQRYLGDPLRWPEIQAANAGLLRDPGVLPIGKLIRIPARVKAGETDGGSPALKPVPVGPISEPISHSHS